MELEIVAMGVLQAGVEIISASPELDSDQLLEALIEVVCIKTGVRSVEAHKAILRAVEQLKYPN